MLRFLLRILFTMMLFLLGRLLGPRERPGRGGRNARSPRPDDGVGGAPRGGAARPSGAKGPPPLDRSDVVDVPFTEIPSDPASGAAGRP